MALGLAVVGSFDVGNTRMNVIGKWIHDWEATNRWDGDLFMVSLAFKL